MSKETYEKAGLFYLGRDIDKKSGKATEFLTLLKNKDFTTHAAIIGMTGSGKTGLGISLIEEAAMDNIPALVIDPKGDMGNLMLIDPTFSPQNYTEWVRDEAIAKGEDVEAYASRVASEWREGLESWGQSGERLATFAKVKKSIYTPGSSAGIPIDIMASLKAPPREILDESDSFGAYLKATVSSLLSLVGSGGEDVNSKEAILLSQIIATGWLDGKDIDIATLIASIITPPFTKIGVLPLESYFPQAQRFALATNFNAVIASPSFASWMSGETLDIQRMLYDEDGKAKIAIISIAHLSDEERMFFVTLLLNKFIAWMRQQSGTVALKAILYMDEIFGFFPPSKNPPSKEPMLLLLKQARAFGIGVVLSTQNPVDLDYKGLSNIGTWLIGRLQTPQDIERVIDGLEGKADATYTKGDIEKLLASMQKRTFFLKSAHMDDIGLFTTRWTMSYLKGPLKKEEISTLMKSQKTNIGEAKSVAEVMNLSGDDYETLDLLPSSTEQYYEPSYTSQPSYLPTLTARAKVHFYDKSRGIDEFRPIALSLLIDPNDSEIAWEKSENDESDLSRFSTKAPDGAKRGRLPEWLINDKEFKKAAKGLTERLYAQERIELYRVTKPKLESKAGESLSDFKVRFQDILNDQKEEEIERLKGQISKREETLKARLRTAKEKLAKEESDVAQKTTDTILSVGMAVFGALMGKKTSAAKVATTLNKGSKVIKEKGEVSMVQGRIDEINTNLEELGYELEDAIDKIDQEFTLDEKMIETFTLRPTRTDIKVEKICLAWRVAL
jgi:hypothetical protein